MRRQISTQLITGVMLLALLAPACSSTGSTIKGTVKHQDGSPVANIAIELGAMDDKGDPQSARTDSEGRYTFGNVVPATYLIAVVVKDQCATFDTAAVKANEQITIDLTLPNGCGN